MGPRIERQSPEHLRGAIPEPIGSKRVRELVYREPDEQHDRDHDDRRDEVFEVQGQGTSGSGRVPYRSGP